MYGYGMAAYGEFLRGSFAERQKKAQQVWDNQLRNSSLIHRHHLQSERSSLAKLTQNERVFMCSEIERDFVIDKMDSLAKCHYGLSEISNEKLVAEFFRYIMLMTTF